MHYPRHIAIIPDGNRTRATDQGRTQLEGHAAGRDNAQTIIQHVFDTTPIDVVTIWGLSTENLTNRSKQELDYLYKFFLSVPEAMVEYCRKHQITMRRAGSEEGLPDDVVARLREYEDELSFDTQKTIVLCINYGGRDEILRGVNALIADGATQIDEESLSRALDFGDLPCVDLVVRTKGDMSRRLSGYLLWWVGYAELYFSSKKFPAFGVDDMDEALAWFDSIVAYRNFGK